MKTISVVVVVKNEEKYIAPFLENIQWVNEIIIVDNGSTDESIAAAKKFTDTIFTNKEFNLGILKQWALKKATSDWILLLDVDELVSVELKKQIENVLEIKAKFDAFWIPYENHFLGHALKTKAQQYAKARFFKNGKGTVSSAPIHEEIVITGKIGELTGPILHYSFRSIPQVFTKFTDYAKRELPVFIEKSTKVKIQYLTLYPLHMFWSIFVEDKGYEDGIWGFGLAICFAYYEFMRYWFLWVYQVKGKYRFPLSQE